MAVTKIGQKHLKNTMIYEISQKKTYDGLKTQNLLQYVYTF